MGGGKKSQAWVAKLLEAYREAIQRHLRSAAAHEAIIRVLRAFEQQSITAAQAVSQLEEAAASQKEPGLAALYRQTIERLREH